MTDMTSQTPVSRSHKPPRAEFNVYFALIFLLALPLALIAWTLAALRGGGADRKGAAGPAPGARHGSLRPMIFSA
jgi:hypothetical protein